MPLNRWMAKEKYDSAYMMVFYWAINQEWNHTICRKTNGNGNHHLKPYNPDSEGQMSHPFFFIWRICLYEMKLKLCCFGTI